MDACCSLPHTALFRHFCVGGGITTLGVRLGEGSGCPIAFRVVEAACAVMCTMATFPEAAINDEYLTDIRAKDSFTV